MKLRYVEARHTQAPCVLSQEEIAHVGTRSVNLLQVQDYWRSNSSPAWQLAEWGSNKRKQVKFNQWLPQFTASAACDVRTASDPADAYGQNDALCFRFNSEAVEAMAQTVANSMPSNVAANMGDWKVQAIYLRWLANCQLIDNVTVFDIANTDFAMADFEAINATLTKPIDFLWPVIISVIDYAARNFCQSKKSISQGAGAWDNKNWPFGQPRAFYEQEHPDFDPSNEYQYDAILIVEGQRSQLDEVLMHLRLNLDPIVTLPNGDMVFISERATTVLYRSSSPALEPKVNLPFGREAHAVLGIVFVSLILKYDSYNQRLYAAILNELVASRLEVDGETLRQLVYRTEQLRITLHARSALLSEHLNKIYDAWTETCGLLELSRRVDRLSDLVISAAEGIESKGQQAFERRVQGVGLIFLIFTFVTFIADMWNFTHADRSTEIGDYLRSYRVAVFWMVMMSTAILALVALLIVKRQRHKKISRRLR